LVTTLTADVGIETVVKADPPATVTTPGLCTRPLVDVTLTLAPPPGALPVSQIVAEALVPPVMVAGLKLNEFKVKGGDGTTVREPEPELEL
jgi:hypothetical protein